MNKLNKTSAAIDALILNDTFSLDMAFLLDATGSMADTIEGVKENIEATVHGVMQKYAHCKVRVGVVAYRDFDVQEPPSGVEMLDFTEDISAFKGFLARLEAHGGDDDAEDVLSGLRECARLSWNANARTLIHIADAPCHGHMFHTTRTRDKYADHDPNGTAVTSALDELLAEEKCGVQTYQFIHLNDTTKHMMARFKDLVKNKEAIVEDHLRDNEEMPERFIHSSLRSIEISTPHISRDDMRRDIVPPLPMRRSTAVSDGVGDGGSSGGTARPVTRASVRRRLFTPSMESE